MSRKYYLELLKEGSVVCAFDTETTGLRTDTDRIIQFTALKYIVKNGEFKHIDKADIYIDPERKLDKDITELTGITDGMLVGKPTESAIGRKIIDYISDSDVWVGYNVGFDIGMLEGMAGRLHCPIDDKPSIDVMELARDFISNSEIGDHKLETVAEYLVPEKFKFHNALDDVNATVGVMGVLLQYLREYTPSCGSMTTHLEKGSLWNNRYKKEVRIRLTLSDGEEGDIYYDLFDHAWKCKSDRRAMELFNSLDLVDMERQFLEKYGYRFGHDSVSEIGFSWLDYRKEQKSKKRGKGA